MHAPPFRAGLFFILILAGVKGASADFPLDTGKIITFPQAEPAYTPRRFAARGYFFYPHDEKQRAAQMRGPLFFMMVEMILFSSELSFRFPCQTDGSS
jgi:hypothetical protein